jgi:hypothetical protein
MAVKKTTDVETPAVEEVVEGKQEVAVVPEENNEMMNVEGLDLSELGFSDEEIKALTGLDAIDSSEIRIPYATLISKATRDNELGDIVFPDGRVLKGYQGEIAEGISVLSIQPVRVYFPQPFNPNNGFICRSLDGKVGAPDGAYPGQACATCEFSQYPEAGGSSPCRDQRLLLCTNADGSLFHLQVGGVGVGVWKTFMSAQVFHLLPKAKNLLGALNISFGVKKMDTNFGPFPAIDFRIDPKKPFHPVSRLKSNLNSLKSYKEFENFHVSTAADQTRVQMAVGEADSEAATGPNNGMF